MVGHVTYKYTYVKEFAQNLSLMWVPHEKYEEPTNLEGKYNCLIDTQSSYLVWD